MSLTVALLLALLFPIAALAQGGMSHIRLVHVYAGGPTLGLYLDNAEPAVVVGLGYGNASEWVAVTAEEHRIAVGATGLPIGNAPFDSTITFAADSLYTLVTAGSDAAGLIVFKVLVKPLQSDTNTDVHFLNASPVLGSVDLRLESASTTITATDLAFAMSTPYTAAGSGDVTLYVAHAGESPFYKAGAFADSGRDYTVILAGDYTISNPDALLVFRLVDNDSAAQIPMAQFTPRPLQQGGFRAVHVGAGLDSLDIFRDGDERDSVTLAFRHATALRTDIIGPQMFRYAPVGLGRDAAIGTAKVTIGADTTVTLVILGGGLAPSHIPIYTSWQNTPMPGNGYVRFLNAIPDVGALDFRARFSDNATYDELGIAFGSVTDFRSVAQGPFSLELTSDGGQTTVGRFIYEIPDEGIVTIIATGGAQEDLILTMFVETNNSQQEPMIFLTAIASVRAERRPIAALTVAPNPARDRVRIAWNSQHNVYALLNVVDATGRVVRSVDHGALDAGHHETVVDLSGLASGSYTLQVQSRDGATIARGRIVLLR